MGFRDDSEAVRARADALERENRDLRRQLEQLQGGGPSEDPGPPRRRSPTPWIAGGVLVLVLGAGLLSTHAVPVVVLPVLAALAMVLLSVGVLTALMYVVGPNEALVISGRQHRLSDGRAVGYRVVRGGRVIKLPFVETVDRLSLRIIPVEVKLTTAYAKGGKPVQVEGHARVKIASHPPELHNAVERFLCRPLDEVARVAAETIEGHLRAVVAVMPLEELVQDKLMAAHVLLEEADDDMKRLGLVIDTFTIQRVAPG